MKFVTGIITSIAAALIVYRSSDDRHSTQSVGPFQGEENYFKTSDDIYLWLNSWPTLKVPIGIIFLIHGFHEHSARDGYIELIQKLNNEGFIVYGHDHQGHGRSNGDKAYFPSIMKLRDDAIEVIEALAKGGKFKSLPVYIWGQSMGGQISTLLAHARPDLIDGMVLTSPAIKLDDSKLNFVNTEIAPYLSKLLPRMWFPESVPLDSLTRNEKAKQAYVDDELNHTGGFLRVRSGAEILAGSLLAQACVHEVAVPFLILHGTLDGVVDIKGSELLYAKAISSDKTFIPMDGVFHEIYEDEEREKYLSQAIQWVRNRAIEKVSNGSVSSGGGSFSTSGGRKVPSKL